MLGDATPALLTTRSLRLFLRCRRTDPCGRAGAACCISANVQYANLVQSPEQLMAFGVDEVRSVVVVVQIDRD